MMFFWINDLMTITYQESGSRGWPFNDETELLHFYLAAHAPWRVIRMVCMRERIDNAAYLRS